MVSGANHVRGHLQDQAEQDLLNLLVQADSVTVFYGTEEVKVEVKEDPRAKAPYPWTPAEADEFFASLEHNLLDGLDDQEVSDRSQAFFQKLDQLWDPSLQVRLSRKFVTVPQTVLAAIAQQAITLIHQSNQVADQLADQLVNCVQTVLPQWAAEDLYVFARPVAYAMRGDEGALDLSQRDWQALSEVEQAKLTLAIAKYALQQVQTAQ